MSATFTARNMHDLTDQMVSQFKHHAYLRESRNGTVMRLPGVTTVTLSRPLENVCFLESRDANPFFHLIEALAMIAGENSVEFLSFFASNMKGFSDNGRTYNAFYGTRARNTWGDQIDDVIRILRDDPDSRQAIVNLWDPADLNRQTKDKACNLMMIFTREGDRIDMTTFNRSNDAVWGFMTGANMVHFPFFHEYVACALDCHVGSWHHSSANMHVYTWNEKWIKIMEESGPEFNGARKQDLYLSGTVQHTKLFDGSKRRRLFDTEVGSVIFEMKNWVEDFNDEKEPREIVQKGRLTPILRSIAIPAFNAFKVYKLARRDNKKFTTDDYSVCAEHLNKMPLHCDWNVAMARWLISRIAK